MGMIKYQPSLFIRSKYYSTRGIAVWSLAGIFENKMQPRTLCSPFCFFKKFLLSYEFFFRSNDAVGNRQTGGIVKISRAYVLSAYGFSRDIFTRDGTYSIDVRRNILEARTCASSQILNIHVNRISQVISKITNSQISVTNTVK